MTEFASLTDMSFEIEKEAVTLPNGLTVEVKALTRFEYSLALKNATAKGVDDGVDIPELETHLLRFGMSQPKMNADQARAWLNTSPSGVAEILLTVIRRLSKIGRDADKSDVS